MTDLAAQARRLGMQPECMLFCLTTRRLICNSYQRRSRSERLLVMMEAT